MKIVPISILQFLFVLFIHHNYGETPTYTNIPNTVKLAIQIPDNPLEGLDESIKEKIKIEISSSALKFAPCVPIIIDVTATNVSNEIVIFQDSDLYNDFNLDVKTKEGKSVPLTLYGQHLQKTNFFFRYIILEMKPSDFKNCKLLANQVYDMTMDSVYTIRVKSSFRQRFQDTTTYCEVWSNSIDVVIDGQLSQLNEITLEPMTPTDN